MRTRVVAAMLAVAAGGCSGAPAEPENQLAAALANAAPDPPAPASTAPAGSLEAWLTGTWSFEQACGSEFMVRYEPGGALQNSGDGGSWRLDGDQVTETVTERFELGDDAPRKLDPPETRRYAVTQIDQTHGTITIDGRKVPILRC